MEKKRIAFLRLLLVAVIGAGCGWAIKANRGFFGGAGWGDSSFDNDQADTFSTGPEGEEWTAEETNDDDYGFTDAGTDSLGTDGGFGSSDSDGTAVLPQDEGVFEESSKPGSMTGGFDSAYHTHAVDYYEQHNGLNQKEEEYVYHPVSVYDKNKPKKEEVEHDK